MLLTSPIFENNGAIPSLYSCDGEGKHPLLHIKDVVESAKSLVLIVDDPDAPMGIFTHWVIWNLPMDIKEIAEDINPQGSMEGKNSAGSIGWIAPCPPSGTHHYRFYLYALGDMLDLPEGADRFTLEKKIEANLVDKTELVGLYSRDK